MDTGGPAPASASRAAVGLLAVLSTALVGWMLVRVPTAHGDSDEYLLTIEAFANHGTPDIRPADLASLLSLTRSQVFEGHFGPLSDAVRQAPTGRWYTYHFWLYPLVATPARVALALVRLNPLAAAQITNALLLAAAAWFALLAPWLDRRVAGWWSLLTLIGPPAWFCVWPHPEVFSFALVTSSLVLASGRRYLPAAFAAALAATQNPPLVAVAGALAALSVRTGHRAWSRRAALALAALAPAFLPPVFYLWTFGRPSLVLGESADLRHVSVAKAMSLMFDLNTGLLPYWPGAVLLALAALATSWRRPRPFPHPAACFAAFGLGALGASAGVLWNFGTSGPSRYAVWLSPFLLLPAAQWAVRRRAAVALTAALALDAAVVFSRLPRWGEDDEHRLSYAAAFVLSRWPALYSPHPDIFRARTVPLSEHGPHVLRDDAGRCTKALAQKRHGPALADACGGLPAGFAAWTAEVAQAGRGRNEWRYFDYRRRR